MAELAIAGRSGRGRLIAAILLAGRFIKTVMVAVKYQNHQADADSQ